MDFFSMSSKTVCVDVDTGFGTIDVSHNHQIEVFSWIPESQCDKTRYSVITQHINDNPRNLNQPVKAMGSLCHCLYVLWQINGQMMTANGSS